MQLSVFADIEAGVWDVAVDAQWLGDGPGTAPTLDLPAFDPSQAGSVRQVAVWLADGGQTLFSAIRARGAKGNDKDEVIVTVTPNADELRNFDARLSTEYAADGSPRRFGIEVWRGVDEESEQQPLRLAGEAAENQALIHDSLTVIPMRAQRHGVPGLALYLLVNP